MPATQWVSAAKTDRGRKRKINEDAILSRPDLGLWVAADGMGGHEAGDVASNMIVDTLNQLSREGSLAQFADQVEDALLAANESIRQHSATMFGGRTMGATVVTLLLGEHVGVSLWAGDSRLYRFRDGQLEQLTRDHSEVQELLDRGVLTEEEAENHPNANVITRAVGGAPRLFLDAILFDVQPGDIFLLCSDGLYNELSRDEICERMGSNLEVSAKLLLETTLQKGARDNVSIVLVKVEAAE